jgi:hypothetical protein
MSAGSRLRRADRLTLAGCYGSTEPATDVGPESATLRPRDRQQRPGAQLLLQRDRDRRIGPAELRHRQADFIVNDATS